MAGSLGVTQTDLNFNALIAIDIDDVVILKKTVLAGENLVAGTIMGRITASGKLVHYDAAGTDDGRRTPIGVLLEDTNSASDALCMIGFCGVYVKANMTGLDAAGESTLESRAVYFK